MLLLPTNGGLADALAIYWTGKSELGEVILYTGSGLKNN